MFFARDFTTLSHPFQRLRRHAAAMLMVCLFCLFGGRPAYAGNCDNSTVTPGRNMSGQAKSEFYRTHEQERDAILTAAEKVIAHINDKNKRKTKGKPDPFDVTVDSDLLDEISNIVDPRAEDILLNNPEFTTGWMAICGVARQDPATVVPKLMTLFEQGFKTGDKHENVFVKETVGYVYGTMFENGRLSAGSPHYVKIRSQILTLQASRDVGDRYVATYALRRLPPDADVTAALERLAKDPSAYVRDNAKAALAARAERFKSGATPPAQ